MEFEIKFIKEKLNFAGQEREIKLMKVSPLMRAEYQSRLLNSDTCTLGALQNNDVKVNLDVLAKRDLYLLAYVIKAIEDIDEYKDMTFNKKLEFFTNYCNAYPDEFSEFVKKIKESTGDILDV